LSHLKSALSEKADNTQHFLCAEAQNNYSVAFAALRPVILCRLRGGQGVTLP
jgi:hypothetical protein